jgi:hypothetical protein
MIMIIVLMLIKKYYFVLMFSESFFTAEDQALYVEMKANGSLLFDTDSAPWCTPSIVVPGTSPAPLIKPVELFRKVDGTLMMTRQSERESSSK